MNIFQAIRHIKSTGEKVKSKNGDVLAYFSPQVYLGTNGNKEDWRELSVDAILNLEDVDFRAEITKRDICYRGKIKNYGGWMFGYCYKSGDDTYILRKTKDRVFDNFLVDAETVGQYTGKEDKNKRLIYEHDIVTVVVGRGVKKTIGFVCFSNGAWRIVKTNDSGERITICDLYESFILLEVIGNIYDCPELLKSEVDK